MIVDAIEIPLLLISAPRDGKRRLWIEVNNTGSTSMQLRHVVRGYARELEVIDGAGHYYSRVEGAMSGIAWRSYLRGGLFGPLVLVFSLVFATVLVRVRLDFRTPGSSMPLADIKAKVREAIQTNPEIYTHAPVATIIGRVNAAKDPRSLIEGMSRD
jgi:hypothetical protein